jgi:hypothetical protein
MKLQELQPKLLSKKISASYTSLNNEFVKQERLYLNIHEQFQVYFVSFQEKPFLKVYIQRPKDFDFRNIKQSTLETERCKKAKLQFLSALKNLELGIDGLESYEKWEDVLLSPKSDSIKFEIKN